MANQVKYYLDKDSGEFVIENYNFAKPFSSFLPGIAGLMGIPMWVFYANRGQAIAGFGTKDKDHAIMEYLPANKAYEAVYTKGLRTFLKIRRKNKVTFYEPFSANHLNEMYKPTQKMFITSYGLRIEDENKALGIKVKVEYFTIANEPFAALARKVTVGNLTKDKLGIEILDGLSAVVPYGTNNFFLKEMSRTVEAWMTVNNLDKGVPFYKLAVNPKDGSEVEFIEAGNFYLNYRHEKNKVELSKVVYDPNLVFGWATDASHPREFINTAKFKVPARQVSNSKTPCAFGYANFTLPAFAQEFLYTLIGKAESQDELNSFIPRITKPEYFSNKCLENKELILKLEDSVFTKSASQEFNLYCGQTYLDNLLRGGLPLSIKIKNNSFPFYVYSRKHGDMERDYNRFLLSPTFLSQGNGNYRDMNQNRRLDNWFNADVKAENVLDFFNLIQADGFNPLVIKEDTFILKNSARNMLTRLVAQKNIAQLLAYLGKPFKLGELLMYLRRREIKLKVSLDEFLTELLAHCIKDKEVEHGEGFWTDHWTYCLDLLENYLAVYPESLQEILLERCDFTFFDNTYAIRPRKERYILEKGLARQMRSVASCHAKYELIRKRDIDVHKMRTNFGEGEVYRTNLMVKMLCIIANKLASLDPFGMGIEMEADKPNWFDALNGLPGLFGSSINETIELKRWISFILHSVKSLELSSDSKIIMPKELGDFILGLGSLFKKKDFSYWDESNNLKEKYRQSIRLGFSGKEIKIGLAALKKILNDALQKLNKAIDKAADKKTKIPCSYFINEVVKYDALPNLHIKPKAFRQIRVPLFLEGPMHALRVSANKANAKSLYESVRKSELFDKKLSMYKVTAPLESASMELGRCRVFTPGWLEDESIWLHMEYKYLLELLRCGLYDEFYKDFFKCLIPFQPARRYGRSILENSSFLVSSAFPDTKLHGNGFVARLSGSTVELLNIWLWMNVGIRPFFQDERGKLNLKLAPILEKSLFTKDNTYAFNFLGETLVVYHNPKRKNTFGVNAARIEKIVIKSQDRQVSMDSDTIPAPFAADVRLRKFSRIDIYLK